MSKTTSIFQKVPVKVQDRSGFDMSHENLFTAKIGTLIPASVEEVMPGDIVSVGGAVSVELPPLATNFKGRLDARLEAFFVPNRLLWAGWKDFIVNGQGSAQGGQPSTASTVIPKVNLKSQNTAPGSLADYLGLKSVNGGTADTNVNALPFLAYQKIWDDWYRDSLIQKPFFADGLSGNINNFGIPRAAYLPYQTSTGVLSADTATPASSNSTQGINGRKVTELAQRNFAKDYYTTMTTAPQLGAASQVEFNVEMPDTVSGTPSGSFSIASLRAANALQKWLERNNISGTRYYDQILAHYGVLPSDAVFQRAVLLGSMTTPVIVNSIGQTAPYSPGTGSTYADVTATLGKNPYGRTTGAQFGHGSSFGKDRLIDNFEVKEHGFIIILFSLVPHAYYSTGSRRYIIGRDTNDTYAFPEFAGIGDQPIYKGELYSPDIYGGFDAMSTVGYAQRYAEYKFHDDEVHGLLRDGENLSAFVLQRGFDSSVAVSSDLIEIPTNYLDDVMVVTAGVSGFNAIVDAYFDAKYLRVLPEYSLPSLCESENEGGKKVFVPKNGTRL